MPIERRPALGAARGAVPVAVAMTATVMMPMRVIAPAHAPFSFCAGASSAAAIT